MIDNTEHQVIPEVVIILLLKSSTGTLFIYFDNVGMLYLVRINTRQEYPVGLLVSVIRRDKVNSEC